METNLLSVLEHGAESVESRRNALAFVGKLGAGAVLSMLPFGLADEAMAQSAGNDVDILNFALTLEYLESSFYNQYVIDTVVLPTNPARPLFNTIKADEAKHVAFLATALGSSAIAPIPNSAFDFTAGGMFNPLDYDTFLILAQGFEDTGVRAYKGQAAGLSNKDFLTAALNIHSVEARHAAAVRKVRGLRGWIPGDGEDAPAPIQPNYAGEGNMTQGGVTISPVSGKYDARQIQEAFDETLDRPTVLNLVDPFIR